MKDFKVILFLGIVASICAMLLSGVDIASQKASAIFSRRLYKDILEKFEIPVKQGENIEERFAENFDVKTIGSKTYYISKVKEKDAVIFKAYGPGLWGTIEVLLAVYPNFERLLWFKVLAQTETPGLGGRIAEREFQEQFNDVEIRPELKIVKFATGPNQVDAVTGASMTCKALEKLINEGIRELDQSFGREKTS